jgi:uncharacterized membrane protein
MTRYVLLWLATVPVFFAIDLVWLGVVAGGFYRSQMGSLMADPIVWWAAILFYLLFFTYMTYDLTNLATLQGWSVTLAVVDIAWGTLLCGIVATASYLIGTRVLRF